MDNYAALLIMFLLGCGLAIALGSVGGLISPKKSNAIKNSPYESGMPPKGEAHILFNIRYYLVAVMFILFDVETIFLLPWAVAFDKLGLFGLIEAFIFIGILLIGYFYALKKKVFDI